MNIDSIEAGFAVLSLVVPGFVCDSVLAALVPPRREIKEMRLLRMLTLSACNYAIWSWLIYLVLKAPFFSQHPFWSAIAWMCVLLIGPVVLGLLLGWLSQRNVIRNFLTRIGIRSTHSIPTAWDYVFSTTKSVWALATLKNGTQIAGFFGPQSFASSDPSERDFYLQEMRLIDKDGTWNQISHSAGILVSKDDIRYIEFWLDKGDANGKGNEK